MKCKDCPVFGYSSHQTKKVPLCFASCHPTTQVAGEEAECQYGIENYEEYITGIWKEFQNIINKKKGENKNDD